MKNTICALTLAAALAAGYYSHPVQAQMGPTIVTMYNQGGPDVKRYEDDTVVCYKWGTDNSSPWCYKK